MTKTGGSSGLIFILCFFFLPLSARPFILENLICRYSFCEKERQLFTAIRQGRSMAVVSLLMEGVSVEARDAMDYTPLCTVVRHHGRLIITRMLISRGADLDARCGPLEETPLLIASLYGNDRAAFLLMSQGADVHAKDREGRNLYHNLADASYWNEEAALIMAQLLLHSVNINERDEEGRTPLHYAVERQNLKMIENLLRAGHRLFMADNEGLDPYDQALGIEGGDGMVAILQSTRRQDREDFITELINPFLDRTLE